MQQAVPVPKAKRPDDIRFIGALPGRYTLSAQHSDPDDGVSVYACRLCSISPIQAVLVAPVCADDGEAVVMHFNDFGILRARIARELSTGFVVDLDLDVSGRAQLASRIRWKRSNVQNHVPDKREFPRFMPRHPRSVMTMADGKRYPCFVIDISQSGVAVSASILPGKGTPVAIGALIGRAVRRLDVGFAVEFIDKHEVEDLERMLTEPPGSLAAAGEAIAPTG